MDDEILDGVVTVVTGPVEQTAEECLGSIMTAAINEGISMDPADAAAHMRRYLAEHDAGLMEQIAGSLPAFTSGSGTLWMRVDDLKAEATRRRELR